MYTYGALKKPDINQMVFLDVIVFFLLSFFQVLASHLHQANHIVVSLGDVSFQPQALHLFFGKSCTYNEMYIIKSGQCLTRTIFDTRSYRVHYRFVIVLVHVPHAANYQNIGSPLDHIKWLQHMDHSPVSKSLEKEPESNRISSCCCFEPVPETLFDIYV